MINASLQKTGVVTNPIKDGTGTASMLTTGAYTQGIDNQYKIQIESLSSLGIGTAKFRWSRNNTVIASSVITSTAPVAIENGITVQWSTIAVGGTDAFGSTLDQWTFEGKNLFGLNQMIDRRRNTRWRSSTQGIELHTDANAMADPAGNEADSTGSWVGAGVAPGAFDSTDSTASVGTYSFRYQGTSAGPSTISLGINGLSTRFLTGYKLTYDIHTYIIVGTPGLRSRINGVTLKEFTSTSIGFEPQEFNIVFQGSSVTLSFQQPSTLSVGAFIDNLSLRTLPGIFIDFSTAKEVSAVILQDHNLTSNAEITLKGRGDTNWELTTSTSEPLEEKIDWQDNKILHYISNTSNTQRHWRLDILDADNPSSFIEIGDLFLGPVDEMVRNAAVGFTQVETVIGSRNIDVYGVEDNRFRNRQKTWRYTLPASTDIQTLEGIFDTIYSSTDGKYDPVWINPTSASTDFHMVFFDSIPLVHNFRDQNTITLNFREVLKSN